MPEFECMIELHERTCTCFIAFVKIVPSHNHFEAQLAVDERVNVT